MAKINLQKGSIFENGWGIISKKVMLDKDISTTAKAIYGLFCTYGDASSGDKAYPSIKYICDVMDIHKDTFYKHLDQLIEKDYIRKHKHKEKGKFARNEYEIVLMPDNSPFPNSSDTDSSYTENAETINTSSINTRSHKNNNTYILPKKSTESMRVFLNIYERHTGEKHQPTNKSIINKANDIMERIILESGMQVLESGLIDYFDNTNADKPRLDYFVKVAPRYFDNQFYDIL